MNPLFKLEEPEDLVLPAAILTDIHPRSPVAALARDFSAADLARSFPIDLVAATVGMAPSYVRVALDTRSPTVTLAGLLFLLDLDAFAETFIPRSRIPAYLLGRRPMPIDLLPEPTSRSLIQGSATTLLPRLTAETVQCVVTSTPYWGTRIYRDPLLVLWADGEECAYGHEQTPEGFIRHTTELLFLLKPSLAPTASVWWNVMDTYNTRTQIRSNAAETLRAMQGLDGRGWGDFACRRYSAGHSFLKDGDQCQIPGRIAERAARLGYWLKSVITWKKTGSMPETVESRVTREAEYILHLSVQRTPYFDKSMYNRLPGDLGGRAATEAEKLTDVWQLPTAGGQDGHGAQFPLALPGRCIALSSRPNDLVLDPFMGSGTTLLAATRLGRRSLGFDVSETYLRAARSRLATAQPLVALPGV